MKNTLKISLTLIGIGLLAFGAYVMFFPEVLGEDLADDPTQSLAILAFGALCLISGMAYRRR